MSPRRVTYSQRPNRAARAAHARGEREFRTYDTSLIRPHRSRVPQVIVAVVALALVALLVVLLVNCMGGNKNLLPEGETTRVEIAEGSTTSSISDVLYEAGVIADKGEFSRAVSAQDAASSLKPDIYTFEGGQSYDAIVDKLVAGPGMGENTLVIPEGYTIDRIAQAVEEAYAGSITADSFKAAAHNAGQFAAEFPFVADAYGNSLEGFLFPKTYEVVLGSSAEDVIKTMLKQYQQEVAVLNYSYAESQGLSRYDVLILASIVEKEGKADTFSRVAAVFYNRLTTQGAPAYGMLGSDATTAYEIGGEPDNYDWNTDSPYNTRRNAGLPPTPICSPSLEALQAVTSPERDFGEYFFFSFWPNANGGIDYFFDKTYEEHQATIAAHS